MLITNLATNMVVILSNLLIQTNTPEFQNYCAQTAVAHAQIIAEGWHLDPTMIASNKITHLLCLPTAHGPIVDIVFNRRYYFDLGVVEQHAAAYIGDNTKENTSIRIIGKTARDCNVIFEDLSFCWNGPGRLGTNDVDLGVRLGRWANETNCLTLDQAESLAESGIHSIGISMETMKFKAPQRKEQKTALWDSVDHLMPYYTFTWKSEKGFCQVDVSGLSSNIAYFDFEGECPKLEFSTNSFQLLGVSSNTVFVLPMQQGQPHPPYRVFPYSIPMQKNQPVGLSVSKPLKSQ